MRSVPIKLYMVKPTLNDGAIPFGRRIVQDRYVQRRVGCPQNTVSNNKKTNDISMVVIFHYIDKKSKRVFGAGIYLE